MRTTTTTLLALLIVTCAAPAQTVTMDPLPATSYCIGDTVRIGYTATGPFATGNSFIVQLSDSNGSFASGVRTIGGVESRTSGTIVTTIMYNIAPGNAYRMRVVASSPPKASPDNGTDLSLGIQPVVSFNTKMPGGQFAWVTGVGLGFTNQSQGGEQYSWSFGADATPSTYIGYAPPAVTFSTPGVKTVTLTASSSKGCGATRARSMSFEVLDASNIPIAVNAIPVQSTTNDSSYADNDVSLWVCPGGNLDVVRYRRMTTVLVESGGNVTIRQGFDQVLVFAKAGSTVSLERPGAGVIVYEPGVTVKGDAEGYAVIEQAAITFDYANAPGGGCPVPATYSKPIPGNAVVVTGTIGSDQSAQSFWIRGGGTLTATGSGNSYAVESGGTVVAHGNHCIIYVRNGATLDASGTVGHRIFREPSAIIISSGTGAATFPADTIIFLPAVAGGIGGSSERRTQSMRIAPNPTRATATLTASFKEGSVRSLTLWNTLGTLVADLTDRCNDKHVELPLVGLADGVYYVRVVTTHGTYTEKIVVR